MTIDWSPHPEEPGTVLASVDGVNRGYVRQSAVTGWYGRTDYGGVLRPDDGTEAGARGRVETAIRRALVGA